MKLEAELEKVEQLKRGEQSALRWIMEQYGDQVLRTASMLLKDRHLAEDVSQEVFLTAFQRIKQFRGDGSLCGWLLQITVNQCRSRMRRASWKRLLFRSQSETTESHKERWLTEGNAVLEPGGSRWLYELSLREEIEKLPLHYREVIVLFYYQELLIKEIASVLQEPESTIKSKLLRARKLLKIQLEEGGWEDERSVCGT